MLDNDNIISTSISETVEKVPTDEKYCRSAPLCVLFCTYQHIANSRNSDLPNTINLEKTFYIKFTQKRLQ